MSFSSRRTKELDQANVCFGILTNILILIEIIHYTGLPSTATEGRYEGNIDQSRLVRGTKVQIRCLPRPHVHLTPLKSPAAVCWTGVPRHLLRIDDSYPRPMLALIHKPAQRTLSIPSRRYSQLRIPLNTRYSAVRPVCARKLSTYVASKPPRARQLARDQFRSTSASIGKFGTRYRFCSTEVSSSFAIMASDRDILPSW